MLSCNSYQTNILQPYLSEKPLPALAVLESAPWQVGRHTRVERPVAPACNDVDARLFHPLPPDYQTRLHRHCEERSDEAIHPSFSRHDGLLRFARNDGARLWQTSSSSSLRGAKRRSNPYFLFRCEVGLLRYARNDGSPRPDQRQRLIALEQVEQAAQRLAARALKLRIFLHDAQRFVARLVMSWPCTSERAIR